MGPKYNEMTFYLRVKRSRPSSGPWLLKATWKHGHFIFAKSCHPLNLFVCGISLTSGQLITELFPDCLKVMPFASCFTPQGWWSCIWDEVPICSSGTQCPLYSAASLGDNTSRAHMLPHPVSLYWHQADQLCFVVRSNHYHFWSLWYDLVTPLSNLLRPA